MSAAEIIEQIKALPPAEVAVVREFLRGAAEPEGAAPLGAEEARKIAAGIFDRNEALFQRLAQ